MAKSKEDWVFVPFHVNLDRENFDCGVEELNKYIRLQAKQDTKRDQTRIFVATKNETSKIILGFYTLSAGEVEFEKFPPEEKKKIAKYPVPVARIGRLAVSQSMEGKGLGASLLIDAFYKTLRAAEGLAISHIIVDAKPGAEGFYKKFGFQAFTDLSNTLFISLKTVKISFLE